MSRMRKQKDRKKQANEPRSDRSKVLQRWSQEVDYTVCLLEVPLFQMRTPVQFRKTVAYTPKIRSRSDELVRLLQHCLRFEYEPHVEKYRGCVWPCNPSRQSVHVERQHRGSLRIPLFRNSPKRLSQSSHPH